MKKGKPRPPRVYIGKDGKRYIRVNGKKIHIQSNISNEQLVRIVINNFQKKQKRKRRNKKLHKDKLNEFEDLEKSNRNQPGTKDSEKSNKSGTNLDLAKLLFFIANNQKDKEDRDKKLHGEIVDRRQRQAPPMLPGLDQNNNRLIEDRRQLTPGPDQNNNRLIPGTDRQYIMLDPIDHIPYTSDDPFNAKKITTPIHREHMPIFASVAEKHKQQERQLEEQTKKRIQAEELVKKGEAENRARQDQEDYNRKLGYLNHVSYQKYLALIKKANLHSEYQREYPKGTVPNAIKFLIQKKVLDRGDIIGLDFSKVTKESQAKKLASNLIDKIKLDYQILDKEEDIDSLIAQRDKLPPDSEEYGFVNDKINNLEKLARQAKFSPAPTSQVSSSDPTVNTPAPRTPLLPSTQDILEGNASELRRDLAYVERQLQDRNVAKKLEFSATTPQSPVVWPFDINDANALNPPKTPDLEVSRILHSTLSQAAESQHNPEELERLSRGIAHSRRAQTVHVPSSQINEEEDPGQKRKRLYDNNATLNQRVYQLHVNKQDRQHKIAGLNPSPAKEEYADQIANYDKELAFHLENIKKNQDEIDAIDRQFGSGNNSKGLYDNQIEEIMKDYHNKGFKGVYAIDEIDKIPVSDKMGVILNLDTSNQPGSHWVSLFIDTKGDKSVEYYNSFGEDPPDSLMKDLKKLIDKINPNTYLKFKINKIKQQSENSDTCGFMAMRFLLDRFNGKPFKECTGYSEVEKSERKAKKWKNQLQKFGYI